MGANGPRSAIWKCGRSNAALAFSSMSPSVTFTFNWNDSNPHIAPSSSSLFQSPSSVLSERIKTIVEYLKPLSRPMYFIYILFSEGYTPCWHNCVCTIKARTNPLESKSRPENVSLACSSPNLSVLHDLKEAGNVYSNIEICYGSTHRLRNTQVVLRNQLRQIPNK